MLWEIHNFKIAYMNLLNPIIRNYLYSEVNQIN